MNSPERKDCHPRASGDPFGIRKISYILTASLFDLFWGLPTFRINVCQCLQPCLNKLLLTKTKFYFTTADFGMEIIGSLHFFIDYIQGKPSTRSRGKKDFGEAFGVTTSI